MNRAKLTTDALWILFAFKITSTDPAGETG